MSFFTTMTGGFHAGANGAKEGSADQVQSELRSYTLVDN